MTLTELDLLVSPDAAPGFDHLAEQKQRIDEAARDYSTRIRDEIRTLLGSVRLFDEAVDRIRRDASQGKAVEIQAVRVPFLDAFQRRLMLLIQASKLGRHAERLTGLALPEVAQMEAEVGELGKRLMSLATHWQRVEDLVGLTDERIRSRVSPREFLRLSRKQRDEITRRSAEVAEEDYRTNPELLCFEAFGEDDFYDTYPDAAEG